MLLVSRIIHKKMILLIFGLQSMSDESSMGSPRMKTPDLKAKPKGAQLPWWAEENDEVDSKKREAARQSWMKPKITEPGINKQEPDAVDNVR